jgi:hypothetical protein
MTKQQAEAISVWHNVTVDAASEMCTHDIPGPFNDWGETGWWPVPQAWIAGATSTGKCWCCKADVPDGYFFCDACCP